MIFRVDGDLFLPGASRSADLVTLLRNAATRNHTLWVVEDPEDVNRADGEVFHRWRQGLGQALQREMRWLRESLRRLSPHAVTRGAVVITVRSGQSLGTTASPRESDAAPPSPLPDAADAQASAVQLDLASAMRLASMPLFLMVENGLSEAAFLRRVMPPHWRGKFKEWERDGTVRFEHGGGVGEMKRLVLRFAAGKSPEPLGLGVASWRVAHFLICDRDTQKGGNVGADAARLNKVCDQHGMRGRLHILERRKQESYLPREALDEIVAKQTSPDDRSNMKGLLDAHFELGDTTRHQRELPKIGKESWFKNIFLDADLDWRDDWFERDGPWDEMVALAETIASFIKLRQSNSHAFLREPAHHLPPVPSA